MKEHPVLFSGAMVKAILAGKKTQTRRVVKPQPVRLPNHPGWPAWAWKESPLGGYNISWGENLSATEAIGEYCPHGKPGDRLWVRETYLVTAGGAVLYKADHPDLISGACRPSIYMLRQHSRITLEISAVSVQRVQEISDADMQAEGIDYLIGRDGAPATHYNRQVFASLWDKINGKRAGCAWADNPWVWAITFRKVEQ